MVSEMQNLIYWQKKHEKADDMAQTTSKSCRYLRDLRNRENLYGFPPIPMGNVTAMDERGRLIVKPRQSRSESTPLRRPPSDASFDNYFSRFMNKSRSRDTSPKRIKGIIFKNSYNEPIAAPNENHSFEAMFGRFQKRNNLDRHRKFNGRVNLLEKNNDQLDPYLQKFMNKGTSQPEYQKARKFKRAPLQADIEKE